MNFSCQIFAVWAISIVLPTQLKLSWYRSGFHISSLESGHPPTLYDMSGQQQSGQTTMGELAARNSVQAQDQCLFCFTHDVGTLDQHTSPLILCNDHHEKVGEVWSKSIRDLPPDCQQANMLAEFFDDTAPLDQNHSAPTLELPSLEKPRKALLPTPKTRKALLPTPRYLHRYVNSCRVHVIFRRSVEEEGRVLPPRHSLPRGQPAHQAAHQPAHQAEPLNAFLPTHVPLELNSMGPVPQAMIVTQEMMMIQWCMNHLQLLRER